MPGDFPLLHVDELSPVPVYDVITVVAVEQALLTGRAPQRVDQFRRFVDVRIEVRHRSAYIAFEIDFIQVDRSETPLRGHQEVVPVAPEGRCGPVGRGVVPHQVRAAGIGGRDLVAGDQYVAHAAFTAPFPALLPHESVDDVQAGIRDHGQVGEDVGQPDRVMVVCAYPSPRRNDGRQPEQVLHAQGDAHERVILHLRHGNHFVCILEYAAQHVTIEHVAAAGHLVYRPRRAVGVIVLHVEIAEVVDVVELVRREFIRGVGIGVRGIDFRIGVFPKQLQHGPADRVVHQFLPASPEPDDVVHGFHHVELHDDLAGFFDARPGRRKRFGDALQRFVYGLVIRPMVAGSRADCVLFSRHVTVSGVMRKALGLGSSCNIQPAVSATSVNAGPVRFHYRRRQSKLKAADILGCIITPDGSY